MGDGFSHPRFCNNANLFPGAFANYFLEKLLISKPFIDYLPGEQGGSNPRLIA
jgi:hypothetical protein